jgi:hypothetical protein
MVNNKENSNSYSRSFLNSQFLLSFFSKPDKFEEKKVNDFWLIKQFDRTVNAWNVAIYTEEKYLKRKKHKEYVNTRFPARGN